jgi:hypothetical protein
METDGPVAVAHVGFASPARWAHPTAHPGADGDEVAFGVSTHVLANPDHPSRELVAGDGRPHVTTVGMRCGDREEQGVVDILARVGAAYPGGGHPDEQLTGAWRRLSQLRETDVTRTVIHDGSHQVRSDALARTIRLFAQLHPVVSPQVRQT